ncbi:MAG: WYL domain-containing transcriptional regulator [Deltaproteobacteria bacterium]|nr:WYL domain-containing transcriptional regulator [Deltaproteobacteria bacterium]
MRGDQLARQWRIIRAVEASRNGLTVTELAEMENKGVRTIYRDLVALMDAGFPLYTQREDRANRWAFIDTFTFKLPPPFTLTELMSLYLYRDLVRVFKGTAFFDSLESVFKKIRSTLPPKTLSFLERIQSAYHVGIKPYREYGQLREILNQINDATLHNRRIEMIYHPLRRKEETLRKVDPYKVWFFDGTMYLIGHCHLRGEVRMFVMDRIKMLRVTDEKFDPPEGFDLDEFMRHSFKVMHDELYPVKVRISPEWARWVGEKIWHESQKARKMEDGSLELTFQVAGLDEIKRWVMSLGPEVYVIEPEKLREMVRRDLTRTLSHYEGRVDVRLPRSGMYGRRESSK